jgi:hypothetical protein
MIRFTQETRAKFEQLKQVTHQMLVRALDQPAATPLKRRARRNRSKSLVLHLTFTTTYHIQRNWMELNDSEYTDLRLFLMEAMAKDPEWGKAAELISFLRKTWQNFKWNLIAEGSRGETALVLSTAKPAQLPAGFNNDERYLRQLRIRPVSDTDQQV